MEFSLQNQTHNYTIPEMEIYQEVELLIVCIDVTLLVLMLFMICYIIARYLCRLKIKSNLIVLFYTTSFLATVFRLA